MYGIVIIEIYSCNKQVSTLCTVVASHSYIPPKCTKTREPKDECCALWCTHISYNICDAIPLDNLKNHRALPYITQEKNLKRNGKATGVPKIGDLFSSTPASHPC